MNTYESNFDRTTSSWVRTEWEIKNIYPSQARPYEDRGLIPKVMTKTVILNEVASEGNVTCLSLHGLPSKAETKNFLVDLKILLGVKTLKQAVGKKVFRIMDDMDGTIGIEFGSRRLIVLGSGGNTLSDIPIPHK